MKVPSEALVHGWLKSYNQPLSIQLCNGSPMPYKHNAGKRHHILKAKFTVNNWPAYEAGLKQHGSLTLWITPQAIAQWKAAAHTSPGGQARYSDPAIQIWQMLRTAFRIPLCQPEGLMTSVFPLMNLALNVPDHTTISRQVTVLMHQRPVVGYE